MNYIFLFLIFLTGASGIAAQVLLLRELLVNFNGNELIIGVIISNWVIAEAAGAFFGGRKRGQPFSKWGQPFFLSNWGQPFFSLKKMAVPIRLPSIPKTQTRTGYKLRQKGETTG